MNPSVDEFPLLSRESPDNGFDITEDVLAGADIQFTLAEGVTYSKCAHLYNLVRCDPVFTLKRFSATPCKHATLTLLYYADYLTITVFHFYPMVLSVLISAKIDSGFRIPNQEVMTDWASWIIGHVFCGNTLSTCVDGPISDLEAKWPNLVQQFLNLKDCH